MIKAPVRLQDLRRSLYVKAKTAATWRFWGLYVHICKVETLREAYEMAKKNHGAPGMDGVTFEAIEEGGVEEFLQQIRDELVTNTYRPTPVRRKEIPKDGGNKIRVLSIPAIRDRVVQGALKLILEPIFEADFQPGSYGYRPKRTADQAVIRVAQAIVSSKTRVIDLDLRAYFDNVRHDQLLAKVARRIQDATVMRLLKKILKSTGKKGVPQGGVTTPLTQKVISSSNGQLRDGEQGTLYLIYVLRSNTFMAYGAVDQSGEGSAAERRSWSTPASCCTSRSSAAIVTRVRFIRTSSIPLLRGGFPARSTSRSYRGHGADHVEASAAHGGTAAKVLEKQWPDYWSDRDGRVERVSRRSEETWLSRAPRAAHFKSVLTMPLIDCTIQNLPRPTVFWCRFGSAPSAAV